jgi:CubicO group peptidase (beta-lactamase class C family)
VHHLIPTSKRRISRRRLLALAGGAAAATTLAPLSIAAAQTPIATPEATQDTSATELPMPSTLAADASPEFRAVTEALAAAMRRNRVPGTALGILAGNREEHVTLGVASVSSLAPLTPDTLFQIGSLSKTFTATAIWRLVGEGALAVDAPVQTYIPELRLADQAVAAEVTIGNLLSHSAGWYGDEGFDTGDGDDAIARYVAERLPVLEQIFPLGAFFSYNNAAFTLLGRLIEVATGTTYDAALRNLLLGPIGLSDTVLDRDAVRKRAYADSHAAMPINGRDVVTVQTPLWLPRSVDPAGGLWSTTRDVIRYARFHLAASDAFSGGAEIVSAESLMRMREPVMAIPGIAMSMGQNWFVQDIGGVRIFQHNGDTLGQHTEFVVVPEFDFAFVLLTNSSGGTLTATEILDAALAAYPGLESLSGKAGLTRVSLADPGAPAVDLPPEAVAGYVGRYADEGTTFTVASTADGLTLAAETTVEPGTLQPAIAPPVAPAAALTFLGDDEGVVNGSARIPFVRNAAGDVGWLSAGLRLTPRIDGD